MAKKKYIKDSKGVTVSVTTDTLGLEKPLLNENYDIDVHNRNMDKIDEELKPIDDSYIIELFQHDGDTTSPRDYYTKEEADNKFATKEEVENLKQSVSNGKQLIASAITDKEIPTSNTDSFQTMANNIRNIKTGIEVTLDGKTLDYDFNLKSLGLKWGDSQLSTLPYNFHNGSAVIYNNEIHILGGTDGATKHYKFNGTSWVSVSNLPYDLINGCAVIYNNEIHILGGTDGATKHYKWNGTSWVSVSTLPYDLINGCAVIYNNEIHILSSSYSGHYKSHYKFNGTSWVSVSNLPYDLMNGCAVIYNNEIHILGGSYGTKNHYKFNGTSWVSVSNLPYDLMNGCAVVLNNEIHILGSSYSGCYKSHYKFNGTSWSIVEVLPYDFYRGSAVVLNDEIYIFGSAVESNATSTLKHMNVYTLNKVSSINN